MSEYFILYYGLNDTFIQASNDALLKIEMKFENPTDELLVSRLNAWLNSIGRRNIKVSLLNDTVGDIKN